MQTIKYEFLRKPKQKQNHGRDYKEESQSRLALKQFRRYPGKERGRKRSDKQVLQLHLEEIESDTDRSKPQALMKDWMDRKDIASNWCIANDVPKVQIKQNNGHISPRQINRTSPRDYDGRNGKSKTERSPPVEIKFNKLPHLFNDPPSKTNSKMMRVHSSDRSFTLHSANILRSSRSDSKFQGDGKDRTGNLENQLILSRQQNQLLQTAIKSLNHDNKELLRQLEKYRGLNSVVLSLNSEKEEMLATIRELESVKKTSHGDKNSERSQKTIEEMTQEITKLNQTIVILQKRIKSLEKQSIRQRNKTENDAKFSPFKQKMQKEEPENGKDFSFSPKKEKSLLELMPTSSDVTLNTPESTPTPSERMTASSTVRAPSQNKKPSFQVLQLHEFILFQEMALLNQKNQIAALKQEIREFSCFRRSNKAQCYLINELNQDIFKLKLKEMSHQYSVHLE